MPHAGTSRERAEQRPSEPAKAERATRVMLVDDSLTARTIFARILAAEADMVLTAQASTAEAALAQVDHAQPDVILLDLEMPGMGGILALPQFLKRLPFARILVVSSLTEAGARHTVQALSAGAADTLLKPLPGRFDNAYRKSLVAKIRALGQREPQACPPAARHACAPLPPLPAARKRTRVLAVGASTGGVHAISTLLRALPGDFTCPIIVTQHLPASFVPVFAQQLEGVSGRPTRVASDGTLLAAGTITVAPGNAHLLVEASGEALSARLGKEPAPVGCWPAVDPMLSSVAEACGGAATALILSGMGRDGLIGATALHRSGGTVLAQDAQSCAVWGMPRAVTAAGIAAASMPPEQMARWLYAHAGTQA